MVPLKFVCFFSGENFENQIFQLQAHMPNDWGVFHRLAHGSVHLDPSFSPPVAVILVLATPGHGHVMMQALSLQFHATVLGVSVQWVVEGFW